MITEKTILKTIDQYTKHILEKGQGRAFTHDEAIAIFSAAKKHQDSNQLWNSITFALMYGYMKGYRMAVKDCREKTKRSSARTTCQTP